MSEAPTDTAPAPEASSRPDSSADSSGGSPAPAGQRDRDARGPRRKRDRDRAAKSGPPGRRGRGPRFVDSAPPRFDPVALAELSGPPLWQSVHDATVAEVTDAALFVDVQPRGHEPVRALVDPKEIVGAPPAVGQTLRVRLLDPPRRKEGIDDVPLPLASLAQARALDGLDAALRAKEQSERVPGTIIAEVKGGFVVALGAESEESFRQGLRAFLPKSHGEHPRLHERKSPVGEVDQFSLTEVEPERANIVLSRRKSLRERYDAQTEELWETTKVGDVVTGKVRALAAFGAFVDLGGLDALLHASDLSWDRTPQVSSVLRVGDVVTGKVIVVDREKGRIKIGLKQLIPNPWEDVRGQLKAGSDVEGDVVALTDYGVFVRILEGVEGLIHLSEVSWDRIKHVSQRFRIGDRVTARVLDVDISNRRISLSTKALEPNPFEKVREKFGPGTVVRAKVKSLTDFGAFVALDDNVDGLIHIGELSWTEHVTHPSQVVTLGADVEVVVLDVDVARQRVACSIKQLSENPWKRWDEQFQKGKRHTLKVTRVAEQGAYFDIEEGLVGFCANRDLSSDYVARAADAVRVGDALELEVKALDKRRRQVVFSAKAVAEGDTRAAYDEYKRRESETGAGRLTLGDALRSQLGAVAAPSGEQSDDGSEPGEGG